MYNDTLDYRELVYLKSKADQFTEKIAFCFQSFSLVVVAVKHQRFDDLLEKCVDYNQYLPLKLQKNEYLMN